MAEQLGARGRRAGIARVAPVRDVTPQLVDERVLLTSLLEQTQGELVADVSGRHTLLCSRLASPLADRRDRDERLTGAAAFDDFAVGPLVPIT